MTSLANVAAALLVALVLGVFVPWLFMRLLVPSLRESERTRAVNFRGRTVFLGLGTVWLVWAGCAMVASVLLAGWLPEAVLLTLAGPLALVAFAVGLVDDAFGSSAARGFRGHLGALAHGQLTTGGFKLIGIGAASAVVAFLVTQVAPWGVDGGVPALAWAVVAAAAVALTTNFVNLTDLRPGRALKVYSLLAVAGAVSAVLGIAPGVSVWPGEQSRPLLNILVLAIVLLGPVVAVWRYDLGEQGMLGDAGANAMGAVAGMMIVVGLPRWALAIFAVLVFALNLLSEKVSFSAVIERTAVLRWLDGLGRLRLEEALPESSASPPSDVGGARYHLEDDHDTEEA